MVEKTRQRDMIHSKGPA